MTKMDDTTQVLDAWEGFEEHFAPGVLNAIQNSVFGRLPMGGLNYVAEAMRAPSRNVQSTVRSSSGKFPSRKLGRTLGFESTTGELLVILNKEHDPDCIALLDQTDGLKVKAKSGSRTVGYVHTPDFICFEADRTLLIEYKTLEGLERKNARNPGFFIYDGGRWTCPAAEQEASLLGFSYEVWTDLNFSPVAIRNSKVVGAYMNGAIQRYNREVDAIQRYMDRPEGRTISALLDDIGYEVTLDGVYAAIARRAVAFDLDSALLTTHSACELFRDDNTLRAFQLARSEPLIKQHAIQAGSVQVVVGTQLMWNAMRWRCISVAHNEMTLAPNADVQPIPLHAYHPLKISIFLLMVRSGEIEILDSTLKNSISDEAASLIQSATAREQAEANRRHALIAQYLSPSAPTCPDRTVRRYVHDYRQALIEVGNGYAGLLPKWSKSGNRVQRLSDAVLERVKHFINEKYLTPEQPKIMAVYGDLDIDLKQRGLPLPSYRCFCRLIASIPAYDAELARKGRKGAYRYEPRVVIVDRLAVPIAERAFELVHIDHTLIDLVVTTEGGPTRLWLTVMICAATRRVLAFALSFEPPSYRHVMCALRDCVRRHSRLPETIVVDGGKEFHSTYFETFCATFNVIVRRRPKSKARFGSQIERLFGTSNTQLFHTMMANTQNTRNVRQLTPETDPYKRAIWTVSELKQIIESYYFEDYDTRTHRSLLMSPRQAFETSLANFGKSRHRLMAFDETFLILSCPSTPSGTAKVQPDGVKIKYLYYNDPGLQPYLGKSLAVRYDPFNLANAWAQVNGAWLKLTSRHASVLVNFSQHSVDVVTEAWRNLRGNAERICLTEHRLISLLDSTPDDEELLELQRQSELERSLRDSDMPDAAPPAPVVMASATVPEPIRSAPPAQRLQFSGPARELKEL
jgi:putative transposase